MSSTAPRTPEFDPQRIDRALEAFRAFWRGESAVPLLSVHCGPDYRQEPDEDRMVAKACAQIAADAASGEAHILPTFWPDFGTISTARMWGGNLLQARDGGGIHIEPILRQADELAALRVRQSYEESDFGRAIRLWRRVCDRLGTDQVFVRTPDLQGPMNTLALLMDQTELICALYEAPALVEQALDHVTDTLVACVARFRREIGAERVIGNIWPYVVLPDGQGIGITQDYMPLLGPDLYERFELPRLKRIADAFGGVFIHCCGAYAQHLPALARADFKIWGIEAHFPFTALWDVRAALGDELAYVPYVSANDRFADLAAFHRELVLRDFPIHRLWYCVCPAWGGVEPLRAALSSRR